MQALGYLRGGIQPRKKSLFQSLTAKRSNAGNEILAHSPELRIIPLRNLEEMSNNEYAKCLQFVLSGNKINQTVNYNHLPNCS